MYHRYEDALFRQVEHLRFMRTAHGAAIYASFESAMRGREYEGDNYGDLPEGLTFSIMQRICERGEPAYIAPQIVQTINDAMGAFEPEPLLPTDPFTAEGFAYLPEPVVLEDVRGDQLPIRGIAWTPIRAQFGDSMDHGGTWVVFLVHRDDDEIYMTGDDKLKPEARERLMRLPHATLTPACSFWMPYNSLALIEDLEDAPDSTLQYREAARRQWAVVQVLWRLASQVVKTVTTAPRPARRDAKRHGVDQDHVVVVTLRKVKRIVTGGEVEEEAHEDWYSVQFPVRGHWRNQWYPKLGEHRQIWIDAYWKGPEDAPVQNSRRVFEVIR